MNIFKRWWAYRALGKYKPKYLSTHSKAPQIRNHLRHLEHYYPHVEDNTLSQGRREQIAEEIMIHKAKLKKCGVEPPSNSIEAFNMMNEFSNRNYV